MKPGDILVGKVTPKGETQLSPEEKLLRAIFGEKAGDVRDTSLRVPSGVQGIVINAQVFAREGTEPDERTKQIEDSRRAAPHEIQRDEKSKIISVGLLNKIAKLLGRQDHAARLFEDGQELLQEGRRSSTTSTLTRSRTVTGRVGFIPVTEDRGGGRPARDEARRRRSKRSLRLQGEDRQAQARATSSLRASSRWSRSRSRSSASSQVGDKMAGRHGNKGVISRILPDGRHAVHGERHAGRHGSESARRSFAYEHRSAPRSAPRLGGARHRRKDRSVPREQLDRRSSAQEAQEDPTTTPKSTSTSTRLRTTRSSKMARHSATRRPSRDAGVRRREREGHREHARRWRSFRPAARRRCSTAYRRAVRRRSHRGHHVHAQAAPPGRREDPRSAHRTVLARHPAAAGRQGAVRRSATSERWKSGRSKPTAPLTACRSS